MSSLISIDEFLSVNNRFPILDVRSESEFKQGHFPGAVNIPILNDEQRSEVGTIFKKKGRQEAVIAGFDLAGPTFGDFIRKAKKNYSEFQLTGLKSLNYENELPAFSLYCWRGGMRSAIAEWILSLAGFKVYRLKGGYKSFRNWAIKALTVKKNILVLGGMTGSGKTEILKNLSALGENVIDLEGFAHHKGSAFGGLGQLPQPTNEHFENQLALKWDRIGNKDDFNDDSFSNPGFRKNPNFVWIENESRTIGQNQLPNSVYEQIRSAMVVEINIPREKRIERILNEYGHFPVDQLGEMTQKLKKRMGGLNLKTALDFLEKRDLSNWAIMMLDYYDKAYSFGMSQRPKATVQTIFLEGSDFLEFSKKIKLLGHSIMKKSGEIELSI